MGRNDASQITALLRETRHGDQQAIERLIPLVYQELHRIAQNFMHKERGDHTLQPTALVNEVYLRLFNQESIDWRDREHFFAVAATQMRRILVDYARAAQAEKRSGHQTKLSLDEVEEMFCQPDENILALDQALGRLAQLYPRASRVVELRFFCGFSETETAEMLGISLSTLKRDWTFAKAWLVDQLSADQPLSPSLYH